MYNPGVQDRSGELLAQGITSGAAGLAAGIQSYKKNKQETDMQDGLFRFIGQQVKNDPKAVEMFGEDLASYPTMGLSKKKALNASLSAYLADKMQKQEQTQKEAMQRAIIDNYERGGQRLAREEEQQSAMEKLIVSMGRQSPISLGKGPVPNEAVTPQERLWGALQEVPQAARGMDPASLMKLLDGMGGATGANQVDIIDLPFGNKGASVRGSRDLRILAPPTNDTLAPAQKYNLILRTMAGAQSLGDPVKTATMSEETKSALMQQYEALGAELGLKVPGAVKPAPAAAGGLPALPKDRAQLKKGQRYQTSRGPATWDGTQFIP